MEKLNARAKATHSTHSCLPKEIIIIVKQNRLAITVKAFFSVKYFRRGEAMDKNLFMVPQI
jgi:hypothetical protein